MNLHLALFLLSVACATALSIGGVTGFDGRSLFAGGRVGFGPPRRGPLGRGPPGRGPLGRGPPGRGPPRPSSPGLPGFFPFPSLPLLNASNTNSSSYSTSFSYNCSYSSSSSNCTSFYSNSTNPSSNSSSGGNRRRRRSTYDESEAGTTLPTPDEISSRNVNNSETSPDGQASNITPLSDTSSMPNIPGLRNAIKEARNRIQTSLGLGNNIAQGIQESVQRAFRSNDPIGSLRTMSSVILDAYATVAINCPLITVANRVFQEGLRLAREVAISAGNDTLGNPAAGINFEGLF